MTIPDDATKDSLYNSAYDTIKACLQGYRVDMTGNMATIASVLHTKFPDWPFVGFYVLRAGRVDPKGKAVLEIGPYQGHVLACGTISYGRGVCGVAAETRTTQLVPDVSKFPNYIACDSETQSEIVVPIKSEDTGEVIAVLDVDSAEKEWFTLVDQKHLERIVELVFPRFYSNGDDANSSNKKKVARVTPSLYVYDHCPYCVRPRMVLGLKDVEFSLNFLANNDEVTPHKLIGAKLVPIYVTPNGRVMKESLDICEEIDRSFGDSRVSEGGKTPKLKEWIEGMSILSRHLVMPRNADNPNPEFRLPEFVDAGSRDYFNKKKTDMIGDFNVHMEKTKEYAAEMTQKLEELAGIIGSAEAVNGASFSYDDIDLFPRLRSLTIVKDLVWPLKVLQYVKTLSEKTKVPLYFSRAY